MTKDEVEKLAREVRPSNKLIAQKGKAFYEAGQKLQRLCDHILSGDYKREIENAAYERAARISSFGFQRGLCAAEIEQNILSLIQPPAQQKDSAK